MFVIVHGHAAQLNVYLENKQERKKIKRIILKSGLPMFSSLSMPSETDQQKPNYYSKTGKLVNLYNALLYASKRL